MHQAFYHFPFAKLRTFSVQFLLQYLCCRKLCGSDVASVASFASIGFQLIIDLLLRSSIGSRFYWKWIYVSLSQNKSMWPQSLCMNSSLFTFSPMKMPKIGLLYIYHVWWIAHEKCWKCATYERTYVQLVGWISTSKWTFKQTFSVIYFSSIACSIYYVWFSIGHLIDLVSDTKSFAQCEWCAFLFGVIFLYLILHESFPICIFWPPIWHNRILIAFVPSIVTGGGGAAAVAAVLRVCLSTFEANIDFLGDDKTTHSKQPNERCELITCVAMLNAHGLFEFDGIFIMFDTRVSLKECFYLCLIISKVFPLQA